MCCQNILVLRLVLCRLPALDYFSLIGQELQALKEAAGGVLENIWSDSPIPETLHDLSVRLDGAPASVDKQVEMAA